MGEDGIGIFGQDYTVRLENVFEGPMDLLVHLIKKNEVDIYDIPVALYHGTVPGLSGVDQAFEHRYGR
jgi:hypothetical protein